MSDRIMETVVRLAGSVDPSLARSITNAEKSVGKLNLKAIAIGAAFAGATVIALKAVADIGKGLYELGGQFDEAYDAIRVGTGATGESLEALQKDFKDVYTSIPASMEDASKAIADYNTRLGLTGDDLSGLSKQAIQVSSMLGEDLSATIETSSQAFQQWGVGAEDMGKQMDYIFKVSQSTGTGFNDLMLNMQQFGPQLQDMGYSFEQASALMGQMEKAGVNTAEVLGAMKKAVGTLAKEGISASGGMQMYYEKIQNAGSAAEATAIANEVFGARAGSTMAAAIRDGSLAVDELTASLQNSSESIDTAYWDTADFAEKWQLLKNQMSVAFEPLGMAVFDGMANLMPIVSGVMQQMAPVIAQLVTQLTPFINELFVKFGEILTTVGPLLAQLAGALLPPLMTVINALIPPIMQVVEGLLPSLVTIVNVLAPIIGFLAEIIGVALTQAINIVMPMVHNLIGIFTNLVDFIKNVFTLHWGEAFTNVVEIVKNTFGFIARWLASPINIIIGMINTVISGLNMIKLPDWVPGMGGKGINIPLIPTFATGGFTDGISIAGEAGTEAVISFDPAYRSKNIDIWQKAGELLGVSGSSNSSSYNLGGFTFSPNIYVSESMSSDDIISKLKDAEGEFLDMMEDWIARKTAGSYKSSSYAY